MPRCRGYGSQICEFDIGRRDAAQEEEKRNAGYGGKIKRVSAEVTDENTDDHRNEDMHNCAEAKRKWRPGGLVLQVSKEKARTSKLYAEWTEEEFWPYWKMCRHRKRSIPSEILMIAEEVQMELPSSRLTVYHLYEDAFLCARHPGILGADEEICILEHWGTRDFEQ